MKNKKKVFLGIVIILAIMLVSVVGLKITKNEKKESPETLRARSYEQVNPGDEKIDGTEFVQFDAYYLRDLNGDGYAEKIRGTCKEIGSQDTLYMDLNVLTNGTLKNAFITIDGKNFFLSTVLVKDDVIAQDCISNNANRIQLKEIPSGTQKLITGIVKSGDYSRNYKTAAIGSYVNNYSVTNNSVTLTGTHVSDDGTEKTISKTVYFTNDWYGTAITELDKDCKNQEYNIFSAIDEENNKIRLTFNIEVNEINQQLILSKRHIEGTIPTLNGYLPTSVTVNDSSAVFNYDENNRIFVLEQVVSTDDEQKVISTMNRSNKYEFVVEYPLEAYKSISEDAIALNIPLKAWHEGFNNPSGLFDNPYRSNIAEEIISVVYDNPQGDIAIINNYVGEGQYYAISDSNIYKVSKELPSNIYNQVENNGKKDLYTVDWRLKTGNNAYKNKFMVKDTPEEYTDKFVLQDGTYCDMDKYVSNIGVYFEAPGPSYMLGDDGYVNIYDDETNELLHTFTSQDWDKYTKESPYMYYKPIKHIRVETSEAEKNKYFYVCNLKEIDDILLTADFEYEQFLKLSQIYSYATGYITLNGDNEYHELNKTINFAEYDLPSSIAEIAMNPDYISNEKKAENVKIKINSVTNKFNTSKWKDGIFLVKYPSDVIEVNQNDVISNTDTSILGAETYKQDGNIFTKIYTSSVESTDLDIILDVDITTNPLSVTLSDEIELYSYNSICNNYDMRYKNQDIYDLNSNTNIEEYVGYSKCSLNIIAPSSLLTSQKATNYDENGSEAIAPQEAIIDKSGNEGQATINGNLINNYSGTISEIKIVGKIPFEGNTYQLNSEKLGSTFDTTMTSDGIKLSDNLKRYATVYYSYNEKVTDDINAKKNGWTTSPQDWSKVKNYLIDLSSYAMPVNAAESFSYNIQVPAGLDYNQVSYSDYAVYFTLDTKEGKLKTQTEPNKLGFRIAKRYDIEITKYEINTDKKIAGVTFLAKENEGEDTKTATTYSQGVATLKGLYVEKEYTIKEIRADGKYVVDDNDVVIIGHIVDGNLEIEIKRGEFKNTPIVEGNLVKVAFDNEIKYNLELSKVEEGTTDPIQGIRFELCGRNGKKTNYTTNGQGKLKIKLLEPNVQYTLTEIESKGHYLKSPISFMMVRDADNNLKFNLLSGDLDVLPEIDTAGEIPLVIAKLGNEKIPTYKLKLLKKEKDKNKVLKGAQFKITGENKDGEVYTTDENGIIEIDDLYEFIEGKSITGVYTLQEIYPSEGYVLDETPIIFKLYRDTLGKAQIEIISGMVKSSNIDNSETESPILNFEIENEPIFKLSKVDSETKEPLAGVGFELSNEKAISFTTSDEYNWIKNDDGTWQSGNNNVNDSTSILETENFSIDSDSILKFDWSVSSEHINYDYLYYEIINVSSGKIIGGLSTKIGGTEYGISYDELIFYNVEIPLATGTYKLRLTYVKDSSQSSGLDCGYIKNLSLSSKIALETDENGELKLNLPTGIYQISETNPLYGYEANYTKEFAVGESRPAEYSERVKWEIENIGGNDFWINDSCITDNGIVVCSSSGQVAMYDFNGNELWHNIDDYNSKSYTGITKVPDGYIAVDSNGYVSKFTNDGIKLWTIREEEYIVSSDENGWFKLTIDVKFESVVTLSDGVLAKVTDKNLVYKFDFNGNVIWTKVFEGTELLDTAAPEDEYKRGFFEVADGIIGITKNGIVTKFDSSLNVLKNNVEYQGHDFKYARQYGNEIVVFDGNNYIFYDDDLNITSVTTTPPSEHFSAGKYDIEGDWLRVEQNYIVRYESYQSKAELPAVQSLYVENTKKQYKITTEVEGNGGVISGEGQNPYESVTHGENSVKDIIATPNAGYSVIGLTVNGENVTYVANDDGTVELEKFINMTSDKHIVVKFSANASDVIEHHYIKDTTTRVAEDKVYYGEVGQSYSTAPKVDLERYRLVQLEDGSYQIPENASGKFKAERQVVIYYYELKPLELIVHHYIDGTETSLVPDELSEGEQGQAYTTNPAEYPELDEKYELVETKLPENANGTLEDSVTIVTYYYRIKEHKITTEVEGIGGDITGKNENPYEVVLHRENSVKDIIVTPNAGYEIKKITINGVEQELPTDKKAPYTLDKFTNMTEDKHIVVSFDIIKENVSVYKVWKDNDNVASKRPESINIELYNKSELVANATLNEECEKANITIPSTGEAVSNAWKYTYENVPMYDNSGNEINYRIVEKEVRTNDLYMYNEEIEKIDSNNFVVTNTFVVPEDKIEIEVTKNWVDNSNEYTRRPTELKLQAKNGDTVVKEQVINVTEGDTQTYKFTDLAKYDDHGNEVVYTADEAEVNTDDLKFYEKSVNNDTYTITNTFRVPEDKIEIEVNKVWEDNSNENSKRPTEVKLQVKNGTEVVKEQVINVTEGDTQKYKFTEFPKYNERGQEIVYTIDEVEINTDDLKFYSKAINNDTYTITNTFTVPEEKVEVDVTKVWEDNNNENSKRPEQIKLQVKNGDTVVQEEQINAKEGNTQTHKFTNLAKYDEHGNEIVYTVDEAEVNENDLKFYEKAVNNDTNTITNTFKVPDEKININVTKKWEDSNNINGVRPEKITLQVKTGEEIIQEKEFDVTEENEKVYTFENLTKYDEYGNEIVYTIEEADVVGYDKEVNGAIVTNRIKSYKITTEVKGEGGDITGKNDNPYETVTHGGNSVKDIKITPDEEHRIYKITINDVEQELPEDKTVEYLLDKFTNMTEDKHIVVEFTKKEYKITTEVRGEGGDITGKTENPYEIVIHRGTSTKDITATPEQKYKITEITVNGESIEFTPNEDGTYTLDKFTNMTEDKHIVVSFEKKPTKVVVKYVDIDSKEELLDKVDILGKIDDEYTTEDKIAEINEKFANKYEFVEDTGNTEGTMTEEEIEVIYYYRKKATQVKVLHVLEGTDVSNPESVEDVLYDTETIDGKVDDSYTTQNRLAEINENHKEQYDLVNDDVENKNGSMTIDTIYVIYEYRKAPSKIKVRHLEKDTEAVLYPEETKDGIVGEDYETSDRLTEINNENENKYELVSEPENKNGTYTREEQVITYYYQKKMAQIEVNYLEVDTNEVLADKVEKQDRIDKDYTTENKLDEINGKYENKYEFVRVEGNPEGKYTLEKQVITYYYQKKMAQIEVNYLEVDTNEVLADRIEKQDRIDKDYTTENKLDEINGKYDNKYEFVRVEGNTEGKYTLEKQVITYYYQKKMAQIEVNYLDVDTNEVLIDRIENQDRVDKDYTTENKLDEINEKYENKYEFVRVEGNPEGKYTLEKQVITYYYQKKMAQIEVNYLEVDTNEVLADKIEEQDRIDKDYTTENKLDEINGKYDNKYEFVRVEGNPEGKYTLEKQVITYYYQKKMAQIEVNYLDVDTNEVLIDRIESQDRVDKDYTTENKLDEINGKCENKYEFVRVEGNPEGKYTLEKQVITYYYQKKMAQIEVNYIEVDTNEVLADKVEKQDRIDKDYTTENKLDEINGKYENKYEFVRVEGNPEGKYTLEKQVITYYYQKKMAEIEVNYLDVDTNELLIDRIESQDRVDKDYTTENKLDEINGKYDNKYEFVRVEGNTEGKYTLEKQVITYYYQKKMAEIEVNYLDVDTNELLIDRIESQDRVDKDYTTENKLDEINEKYDNKYEFVRVEGNTEGKYTLEKQIITYYYTKKPANVIVKYKDIETDEEIAEGEEITGKVDDEYITVDKIEEINETSTNKYILVEVPEKATGKMELETIEVIYYYKKVEARVVIKYKDIDTDEEISTKDFTGGYVGDEYTTEPKEIDGYELVVEKIPVNKDGVLSEEEIEVIYYYKKIVDTDTSDINVAMYLIVMAVSIYGIRRFVKSRV